MLQILIFKDINLPDYVLLFRARTSSTLLPNAVFKFCPWAGLIVQPANQKQGFPLRQNKSYRPIVMRDVGAELRKPEVASQHGSNVAPTLFRLH